MAFLLQPTHESVLCREKFIINNIERIYPNKSCGYYFPFVLLIVKSLTIASIRLINNSLNSFNFTKIIVSLIDTIYLTNL